MSHPPFLDLPPLAHAGGTVALPGSKSISNRVLLLAGLCEGQTLVRAPLVSDDTRVMVDALRALGCTVQPQGADLRVTGLGGRLAVREASLFLGNAGTAMRPLTAALALLASTQGGAFTLHGVPRMHERPIGDLVDALRALGCPVACLGESGYPPMRVGAGPEAAPVPLRLDAPIPVRGDVSSQFLTALLLALPLVAGSTDVVVQVQGELISKPYVEITLNLLQRFGVAVRREDWERFTIPAGSRLRSPGEVVVEGDASSASYFVAIGALAAVDEPVLIQGVGLDSIQGDLRFVDAARAMGAQVEGGPDWLSVRRGRWPLRALQRDCLDIPDAAMTLAAMALYADGPTRLSGIASWRVKETDRIAAMAAELRRVGAQVMEGPDFIEVHPPAAWRAATIRTYDDHRMAMALSLAAFNPLVGAQPPQPLRILDPRCVGKTFPGYWEALFDLARARAEDVPVIAIDGPTASGKGTLAAAVAARLGYHLLDSGALYRATALAARAQGVADDDEPALAGIAAGLVLRFTGEQVFLHGEDVTAALREEAIGTSASRLSALPAVREALLGLQRAMRRAPGLVADGRDMGTVVFPSAALKVFLTADAAQRAERRHKQLISKGFSASIPDLLKGIEQRDARDTHRSVAPLKPAEGAHRLDNSALSIEDSVQQVLDWWQVCGPMAGSADVSP